MDFRQRTLNKKVSCTGIGLHSGEKVNLTIRPASDDHGIRFVRRDLPGQPVIRVQSESVVDTNLCTSIGKNGCKVSTVEHLMAAFFGLGIDNARVEVDGPEVPIMDGSAAPFIFLLKDAGIKEQKAPKRFVLVKKPFKVSEGNRSVSVRPSNELKICYTIDFRHPLLRNQRYSLCFSGREFVNEISRARTFGFLKDIEFLWENGLARGGSLDNAIVIDEFRVINEDGLRYKDEFVRHKILDFIGDMAILGAPIIGHFEVEKSGHLLNQHMLKKLMESRDYWETMTFKNKEECTRNNIRIPVFGSLGPVPA